MKKSEGSVKADLRSQQTSVFKMETTRRKTLRILLGGTVGMLIAPFAFSCRRVKEYQKMALSSAGFDQMTNGASAVYPFKVPALPYDYKDLEQAISARIMRIHHDKHHGGYTRKLNEALANAPELQKKTLVEILANLGDIPPEIRTSVRNNGGGYFNHALFWSLMGPESIAQPDGDLGSAIEKAFGSFSAFKKSFSDKAATLFGSGWTWLVVNNVGELKIINTANQDTTLMAGYKPILGIDVWEHAYYLQYENRRSEYIENFWKVVNWHQCKLNFQSD